MPLGDEAVLRDARTANTDDSVRLPSLDAGHCPGDDFSAVPLELHLVTDLERHGTVLTLR
jgi:hypothetical protein